jgi:hypothetical protein
MIGSAANLSLSGVLDGRKNAGVIGVTGSSNGCGVLGTVGRAGEEAKAC